MDLEIFEQYNSGDILWLGDWGLLWIVALLVLGLFVVGLSAYDLKPLKPARRWTLVVLRALVYLLAVAMLLEPALDLKNVSRVKNHIAVLVDTSRSMQLKTSESTAPLGQNDKEQTRHELVREFLPEFAELAEREKETHEFTFFSFGETLAPSSRQALEKSTEADGRASDMTQALLGIKKYYEGKEIGGVVVLSDGIDSGAIGRRTKRGEELDVTSQALLAELDAPINTVAAARAKGLKDVAISRILHEDFAFVHNKLSVQVELQVVGMQETSFPVTLRREGEVLQTRQVSIEEGKTRYLVDFEFVPERIGKEIYAVSVPVFEGEALDRNNRGYFLLKVIRDKVRALQVVGRPSWDERLLRRLLKRNPNVDLISFFILRTNQSLSNVDQDEMSLIPFPTQELFEQELGSFDLVIFQNFDFGPYNMRKYLPEIEQFVRDGGGFVMVGGDLSFASGGYARTPIEGILPVELPPGSGDAIVDLKDFRPELTEAGKRHPITQLAFDPATNAKLWGELPAQKGTNIVLDEKPWATVLARHESLTYNGKKMPVITIGEVDEGRVMALTTDSTWRWGFEYLGKGGTPREYQLFWNNAIRWLIKDPELKLVKLELAEDTHTPGDIIPLTVRVAKPDYTPAENVSGELEITWRSLEGLSTDAEETREAIPAIAFKTGASGVANLEFVPSKPGAYELRARVKTGDGELEDQSTMLVVDDVREWRDIIPRDALLEAISQLTDGEHMSLPDASTGDLVFAEPRAVKINRRKVIHLWDTALTFVLILLLLGAEWALRRRWGRL